MIYAGFMVQKQNMNRSLAVFLFLVIISPLKGQENIHKSNSLVVQKWGVSFSKRADWKLTNDNDSLIQLMQMSGQSKGDVISISKLSGDSITDNDAKFGWITYRYDKSKQAWMQSQEDESNPSAGAVTKPAEAFATTIDGLLVFSGTGRWKTLIIPLSITSYLKFNIVGGGETQPLVDMIGTLKKI